jgi:hypothetical protein
MKYLLIIASLLVANHAHADFMPCAQGNVYGGETQAEVVMRCGQPQEVISSQPIWVEEVAGTKGAGKWYTLQWYIYPGGSSGYVYYLKIQDNKVISIDMGPYGTIPNK